MRALPCHDLVKFSNSQQRYCPVCCGGSESKRRIKAGSRIEFILLPSVTAAVLAAPICTDRTFSQSICVDSSLKDLKQVGYKVQKMLAYDYFMCAIERNIFVTVSIVTEILNC